MASFRTLPLQSATEPVAVTLSMRVPPESGVRFAALGCDASSSRPITEFIRIDKEDRPPLRSPNSMLWGESPLLLLPLGRVSIVSCL